MEAYSRRTEEEIAHAKTQGKARGGKTDISMREFIKLTEPAACVPKDLLFGIWANVAGATMMHNKVEFPDSAQNEPMFKCGLPQKWSTTKLVLRCLWTSYDYLTGLKS